MQSGDGVMLWTRIRRAVAIQLAHLGLSLVWNVAGLALIARGLRAPGPTASLEVAAFLLVLGVAMGVGARRFAPLYVLASLLAGLGSSSAILQAFQLDASLWPSAFWRYAGALLNGLGVFGAYWGLLGWWKWRRDTGHGVSR